MTDHDSLITAARELRKMLELLKPSAIGRPELGPELARIDTLFCTVLAGIEDLVDRVKLIEQSERTFLNAIDALCDRVTRLETAQRRFLERLDFLGHIARLLGHEDWSLPDPDIKPDIKPGALATAAQAIVPGASGPASSFPPTSSPASVAT